MLRAFSIVIFKLIGWKVMGNPAQNLPKFLLVLGPHTSNWDFIIGIMARSIVHWGNVKYLAKKELFVFPLGWFFKALGGYPVDRKKNTRLVDTVVEIFDSKEKFAIAVTPEGTRKKVDKLKTGFYHIAVNAGIPMIMVGFDFKKKEVIIDDPFYPIGNQEKDMDKIITFFSNVTGKVPENGIHK